MYVITGATGNIGSKAADTLLELGEKVRVVGRSADRLQRFVAKGAEAAVGNLKDSGFATRTFKGADAVFAMIPPDYTARDFRASQNELGASIATAIEKAGVGCVVNLSSQGAELTGGTGPIMGLRDQEERLNRLKGTKVIHLRPGYFMENLFMNIPHISRVGVACSAVRGDLDFSMIATRDIAAQVAALLVTREFGESSVRDLLGQRDVSLNEAFAAIGREIGMPGLKYEQISYAESAQELREMGLSADFARSFVELCRALNEGRYGAGRARTPQNTTPTSIEEFAVIFAEVYAASAERKAA